MMKKLHPALQNAKYKYHEAKTEPTEFGLSYKIYRRFLDRFCFFKCFFAADVLNLFIHIIHECINTILQWFIPKEYGQTSSNKLKQNLITYTPHAEFLECIVAGTPYD